MSKKNKKNQNDEIKAAQEEIQAQNTESQAAENDNTVKEDPEQIIADLKEQLEHQKKEYAFKLTEFDNYRKRTLNEKAELIKNGAESAMRELLPVIDDLERAMDAINKGGNLESLKEGVDLIYNKFIKYLETQHVKAIKSTGMDFDTDVHEAVTMFPAPDPSMRGKVIDTAVKGYKINDKVLRYAKVVVGS